ncbi:MAG TPA: LysE family translocator [Ktedonobacterales bacterium]
MDTRLLAFVGLAALLTITPGADMAVVTKVALEQNRQAALRTTVGIVTGLMLWATASAVGLAAILTASATAFTIIKFAGAAYLLWLGIQSIWPKRRQQEATSSPPPSGDVHGALDSQARQSPFRRGLLSNLLNPKVGIFYTTFLPQFIAPGQPVLAMSLLLAAIHGVMGLIWLSWYAFMVAKAGDVLRRPSIKRLLDRVTGVVLIAFGLRLAVERR